MWVWQSQVRVGTLKLTGVAGCVAVANAGVDLRPYRRAANPPIEGSPRCFVLDDAACRSVGSVQWKVERRRRKPWLGSSSLEEMDMWEPTSCPSLSSADTRL